MIKWNSLYSKLQRLWYLIVHDIDTGYSELDYPILPVYGKGYSVDVLKKGGIIEIVNHNNYYNTPNGTIRIIPTQYNNGVFIEFISTNGQIKWRECMDYSKFYGINTGNISNSHNL